jgi:mRNA interferase HigB
MRIIALSTLKLFWKKHPQAEQPLKAWFHFVSEANWAVPSEIKRDYPSASFLKEDRVCFNIKGNSFRLIVRINYPFRVVYIRFVGTHNEYDRINATEI